MQDQEKHNILKMMQFIISHVSNFLSSYCYSVICLLFTGPVNSKPYNKVRTVFTSQQVYDVKLVDSIRVTVTVKAQRRN